MMGLLGLFIRLTNATRLYVFNQRMKPAQKNSSTATGAGATDERAFVARTADKLGAKVTYNALHKYEKGLMMPDDQVLMALADALEQDVDFFQGRCDELQEGAVPQGFAARRARRGEHPGAGFGLLRALPRNRSGFSACPSIRNPLSGLAASQHRRTQKSGQNVCAMRASRRRPLPNVWEKC